MGRPRRRWEDNIKLDLQEVGRRRGDWMELNYRTIILPVVLYGCETWSLTLREERRLRVFENRVLRRVWT